jgi:hypothetical protein
MGTCWSIGDGPTNTNGWYVLNPPPMSTAGTQFAAVAGVLIETGGGGGAGGGGGSGGGGGAGGGN